VSQVEQETEARESQPTARQLAALRQIRVMGDPVLREVAAPVTVFDAELRETADRMLGIMHDAPGVGLAATQLGLVRRLLVYDVDDEPRVLVNPVITERSQESEVSEEGCLSVPGVRVPVERALRIRVTGADVRGRPLDFEAEGLHARVIQHETDHLDGILIVDRTTKEERAQAMRLLRETVFSGDM
jgi:peptide deformylase